MACSVAQGARSPHTVAQFTCNSARREDRSSARLRSLCLPQMCYLIIREVCVCDGPDSDGYSQSSTTFMSTSCRYSELMYINYAHVVRPIALL